MPNAEGGGGDDSAQVEQWHEETDGDDASGGAARALSNSPREHLAMDRHLELPGVTSDKSSPGKSVTECDAVPRADYFLEQATG